MIFVGIDCGKFGALARMDERRQDIEIHDTPLLPGGGYDLCEAWTILQEATIDDSDVVVVIEDTISIPHSARGGNFLPASDKHLHFSLGAWCALCASLRLPVTKVHPRTWKAAMLGGVANDKKTEAKVLQQRLRGLLDPEAFCGPRGGLKDGRVDAVWLCEYARIQSTVGGIPRPARKTIPVEHPPAFPKPAHPALPGGGLGAIAQEGPRR